MKTGTLSTAGKRLVRPQEARGRAARARAGPEVREHVNSRDFDALETVVLTQLEEDVGHVDFFVGVLKALVQQKETERAETIFQFVLESLDSTEHTGDRSSFLCAALSAWPECASAREALLDALRGRHERSPNFDLLARHFEVLERTDVLEAFAEMELWLCYDQGHAVYMPANGVGRIADINLALGKLRVAFQSQSGKLASFRIGEAERLLELLPEGHFLLRKLDDLSGMQRLAKDEPAELLQMLFESAGHSLALGELRSMLAGIVEEANWGSWWGRVRNDKRLVVGGGTRPEVSWRGTAAEADAEIVAELEGGSARDRLGIAQRHAGRSSELDGVMAAALSQTAADCAESEPGLAFEVLALLQKLHKLEEHDTELLQALLQHDDVAEITAAVVDRSLRKRIVVAIGETREDWPDIFLRLLATESDSQALAQIYEALLDADRAALERAVGGVLGRPAAAPRFYLWLCREMPKREELRKRANWLFLKQLLAALNDPETRTHQVNLRKLFDPGGVVDLVVEEMKDSEARQLLVALDRGAGLEEYRRESLGRHILDRHPQLREDRKQALYTTAESLATKRAELERLVRVEMPENAEEIKKAKAHGDLSENFEYHAARARQEMLSSRAKTLHDQLQKVRVVDPSTVDTSAIVVGTRVELRALPPEGDTLQLTILGPWESDPANNVLSYMAPVAAALLGAKVGGKVQYNDRTYTVKSIATWKG